MLRWAIVVLAFLAIHIAAASAADIYVSPTGADGAPGTPGQPTSIRAAHRRDAGATVHLAAGAYYLTESLVFTSRDSGTKSSPTIWQADPGQDVVLSGAVKLDNLNWTPYKNGILQADVPAGTDFDQLFVNRERQILARYPNYDPKVETFHGYSADALSPQRIARWSDPAGGFVHAMHPALWGEYSWQILGKENGKLKLEGGWQVNRAAKASDKLVFVENIFEELDAPGEWFLNVKTHTLYFYPPKDMELSSATVEGSTLKSLVEFHGSQESPVKWVTLRGISFTQTRRTFMETKEPLLRTDWSIYRGGAVFFDGAEDCSIENSYLHDLGGNGVFVNGYERRITLHGCRFDTTGASAVLFVGKSSAVRDPLFAYEKTQPPGDIDKTPGPKSDDYPADCLVDQCLITNVGGEEAQSAGVGIDISFRITVRHCSIFETSRAGINIGDGCFGGDIIEFCDVFDTVKITGDHGAFNAWGRDRYWLSNVAKINQLVSAFPKFPTLDVVQTNILRNSRWRCDRGWDIDLDDGSSNYHIYDNLCLSGGLKFREGFNRLAENNILVHGTFNAHVWPDQSNSSFTHNIVYKPYAPIGMPRVWNGHVDDNFLESPGEDQIRPATQLAASSHQDEHSIQGDAQFVDPAHGDFTMKAGSPALDLGIKNFPMDQFGVTISQLKALARTPSFAEGKQTGPNRSAAVKTWMAAKVRNIIGLGEVSAHGLNGETGVLILDLPQNSPLAKAGVHKDDVIVGVDGKTIDQITDLRLKKPPFKITIWRDQHAMDIQVAP